jgi:LPS sulfotransferase NodH
VGGYLVCSVERSGSTLYAELLERTGIAGRPLAEPFNMKVEADAFRRHQFQNYGSYLDFVRLSAATSNGVFGINLMWRHLARLTQRLETARSWNGQTMLEMLQHFIPGVTHFVLTERRNSLAQAVSWAIAYQTDRWRSTDPDRGTVPSYSFELIDTLYQNVLADYLGWENWFALHGIQPLRICYEDLISDKVGALRRTLEFLGLPYPATLHLHNRLEVQSTSLNHIWVERYAAELSARLAESPPSDWLYDYVRERKRRLDDMFDCPRATGGTARSP